MTATVISVCASVVSGATLFFMQRFFRKREEGEKKKEETAKRENILILKSVNVIGKLTMANAIAIRDGRTNGELHKILVAHLGEEGTKEYEAAIEKLDIAKL